MNPSLLIGSETHQELLNLLKAKRSLVISGAANETAKALFTAQFFHLHPSKIVYVAPTPQRQAGLARWLPFFGVPTLPFVFSEEEEDRHTLATFLQFFTSTHPCVLLLTTKEWSFPLPSIAELTRRRVEIYRGMTLDPTELFEQLIERGYHHGLDIHLQPGEYRKIGDTLSIFPPQSPFPFQVLFTYNRVEEIRIVDSLNSSRSTSSLETLSLYPATHRTSVPLLQQLTGDHLLILDDLEQREIPRGANHQPMVLSFTAFPESEEHHVHLRYLSVLKFYTLSDFLNDVRDKLNQQWRIAVVTKRTGELHSILKEEHIPSVRGEELHQGTLTLLSTEEEVLPHSLQNPDLRCALLTDREIFTLRRDAGKQRSVQKLALDFIISLQPGDYVVHMDHGIGRFAQVAQKTVDAVAREYLELHYAGSDRLFIPIDQADKLSKYVHEEGEAPPLLSRLGSTDWKRVTTRIKAETAKIAKELLSIYALRAKARGHAFSPDTPEQKSFEEAFPYVETPGQLRSIQDIKRDMESPHPMDRLICGDVGFGKTEVAMRAAFKAVQDGKQVAFLSPITILADQHYHTFQRRMAGFTTQGGISNAPRRPISIEMLSRFRSPEEQRAILARLRKGEIDIIIGTHRLLQADVQFHSLGLLIVDEEQRFGVKQKEKLKSLRASVDILTLTATPIPRTLNLGLHKFRDITTITTPPPGRLPIITEVRKYSDALVRQAVLLELQRQGQAYILHNRVETIDAFAEKLKILIPEGRFIVSHGQLKSEDLEERVREFKEGAYDVLVSSTIIENGIDLPRANTLIVNEAECFGLAQLYQLRGRVGRGKAQAYAYFLYHTQRLHDDAKKRLRAIVEASELGSGFQISMRDLEIRGAGEILGVEQSGHMKTVGMSHFLRLLKQAVEELRAGGVAEELPEQEDVEINLPIEAFIPSHYIPDEQEKISVYQKLAGSEDVAVLREFEEDLQQEYGKFPRQVENLFRVLQLKHTCRRVGVLRLKAETKVRRGEGTEKVGTEIILTLSPRVIAKHIIPLLTKYPAWRVSGSTLRITQGDLGEDWLRGLEDAVGMIGMRGKKSRKRTAAS